MLRDEQGADGGQGQQQRRCASKDPSGAAQESAPRVPPEPEFDGATAPLRLSRRRRSAAQQVGASFSKVVI